MRADFLRFQGLFHLYTQSEAARGGRGVEAAAVVPHGDFPHALRLVGVAVDHHAARPCVQAYVGQQRGQGALERVGGDRGQDDTGHEVHADFQRQVPEVGGCRVHGADQGAAFGEPARGRRGRLPRPGVRVVEECAHAVRQRFRLGAQWLGQCGWEIGVGEQVQDSDVVVQQDALAVVLLQACGLGGGFGGGSARAVGVRAEPAQVSQQEVGADGEPDIGECVTDHGGAHMAGFRAWQARRQVTAGQNGALSSQSRRPIC